MSERINPYDLAAVRKGAEKHKAAREQTAEPPQPSNQQQAITDLKPCLSKYGHAPCTLLAGHAGAHQSWGTDGHIHAAWTDRAVEPAPPAAPLDRWRKTLDALLLHLPAEIVDDVRQAGEGMALARAESELAEWRKATEDNHE